MEKIKQSEKSRFQVLLGDADCFDTIEELVAKCDQANFWADDFFETVVDVAKKSTIRRLIRDVKDEFGWPSIASIETINEAGETVRVYKQEALFDVEDYRQVIYYHGDRSRHHRNMAVGYARRCKLRFNRQLPLGLAGDATDANPRKPR
jgi:hypothetical protein